ncbi:hypothetical protein GCM10010191_47850 [Actinomadura vinacea]|uniref:Uncharacterized protein n=1 Tax=Actinomadura vinacea TaxID=115336 RepID=A0ABN3JIH6_9ACTN
MAGEPVREGGERLIQGADVGMAAQLDDHAHWPAGCSQPWDALALTTLQHRPRPVMATRQLFGQVLSALPEPARTLPAAQELRALTVGA